ncbi:MAG: TauD/TfdA family dioxygenase [Gammaproteobacteria bacterium]|nr:TauD/TfdA family dioxygenase [Gammaproteobacteria bacterium]
MSTVLRTPLSSPMTWAADTLLEDDGLVALDTDCRAELDAVAAELEANPLPIETLSPDFFEMPACAATMQRVRTQVYDGIGFAIIDRLAVERLSKQTATGLYWLLMSLVGRPVAQKWDGTMLYDVLDTGKKSGPGTGVRSSKTNGHQGYHTDNAFNLAPDCAALLCLQTAKSGGVSGLVSLETVYNILLDEHPDLVPRLYESVYWDRQMEHAPEEARVSFQPVFASDGERVLANYSPYLVLAGYHLRNEPPHPHTRAALDALIEVPERDGLGKSFVFERGQIQILNNRRIGHRRTAFEDWDEPERRRHLVRIWLRDAGRPFYHG